MFEWWTTQPATTQIIILVLVGYLVWTGGITLGWINIKKKPAAPLRHQECPNYEDHLLSLDYAQKRATAPYILIRDQMTQSEDVQSDIRSLLSGHYLKLLKQHRQGEKRGLTSDPEYLEFMTILDYVLIRVKQKVLHFYRENHLAELTELEFDVKTEERIQQIINIYSREMNELYPIRMDISREALFDHNQAIIHDIEERLENMFKRARALAQEAKDNLEKWQDKSGVSIIVE